MHWTSSPRWAATSLILLLLSYLTVSFQHVVQPSEQGFRVGHGLAEAALALLRLSGLRLAHVRATLVLLNESRSREAITRVFRINPAESG